MKLNKWLEMLEEIESGTQYSFTHPEYGEITAHPLTIKLGLPNECVDVRRLLDGTLMSSHGWMLTETKKALDIQRHEESVAKAKAKHERSVLSRQQTEQARLEKEQSMTKHWFIHDEHGAVYMSTLELGRLHSVRRHRLRDVALGLMTQTHGWKLKES